MSANTTQACSATDTAARAIGRLAAHYKYGDMSADAFTAAANAALDPLRELERDGLEQARLNGMGTEREAALLGKLEESERNLLAGAAREAELMDRVEWLERQLALRGIVQP